ncbi:MAG: hypothetical protein H6932_17330 [Burkholderiaceae bacterium]|nr:hypothetical protein [Burkholderiaceae bacterium]
MYDLWYQISRDKNVGINLFVEAIIQLIYSAVLKPGDVAIDGGANRGLHLEPMARIVGPKGLAVGFEAFERLALDLQAKLMSVPQALVVSRALGSRAGKAEFVCVRNAHTGSGLMEHSGRHEDDEFISTSFPHLVSVLSSPYESLVNALKGGASR